MSLTSAIGTVLSGLRINQRELEIISSNVANADTPGYTRKVLKRENLESRNNASGGVREAFVGRTVNAQILRQLRDSISSQSYAQLRADFGNRIDALFGKPGAVNALDTIAAKFTSSLEKLANSPGDLSLRIGVLNDANNLAQKINQISNDVQQLRMDAEQGISDSVSHMNELLRALQQADRRVLAETSGGRNAPPDLLDTRDNILSKLAKYSDLTINEKSDGSITVLTPSGGLLYENQPATLSFNQHSVISARSLWNEDSSKSGVGSIKFEGNSGVVTDAVKHDLFASGEIGAYLSMRDDVLVNVQEQLDDMAHALARALSDNAISGTAATAGTQTGFDIDLASLQSGNVFKLGYTNVSASTTHQVSFVRVDDASHLPLSDDFTGETGDTVHGIDFSGGMASVVSQIQAALGSGFTVSNPSGSTIRILDDGAAGTTNVDGLNGIATSTATVNNGTGLPLFVDGGNNNSIYTGALDGESQKIGFAGRISVNQAITSDNALLVRYATSPDTPAGDSARPRDLVDRLQKTKFTFSAGSGIGTSSTPFEGTFNTFMQQMIIHQGAQSENLNTQAKTEKLVFNELKRRNDETSAVSVDQEMGRLMQVQSAYTANARVMTAVNEMIDELLSLAR